METAVPGYKWLKRRHESLARPNRTRLRFDKELAALGLPTGPLVGRLVDEHDLAPLPSAARRYLRYMRVVGRPRDWSFRAGWTGEFRRGPTEPWTPCEAWQYDNALAVARIFHMKLTLGDLFPTVVRDTYIDGRGRMRAKVFDVVKVVDATGPELDIGELVTYLNDAILYAPSMILCPNTEWTDVGENCFDVKLSDGGHTVSGRVLVDTHGAVCEFSTRDRFVNNPYDKRHPLVRALWTTPVDDWVTRGDRVVPSRGTAIWHLPEGSFEYARFRLTEHGFAYNVGGGT